MQKNYNNSINLFEKLEYALAHGSGINGDWKFSMLKNGKIKATNFYHAMDENGFYCEIYDFNVILFINESGIVKVERIEFTRLNNRHKKEFFGLEDYLWQTIELSLTDW